MIKKSWFSISNIVTAVMLAFTVAMVINPNVKAWAIQNLMLVGLFQPDISEIDDQKGIAGGNKELPPFKYSDSNGVLADLKALKGKVVFINFWATWCPPCIAEMPSIQLLREKFKDDPDIVFLMVDVDGDFAKSSLFQKKHRYDFKIVIPATAVSPKYMTGTIPTTLVVDQSGKIVFRREGAADYSNAEFLDFMDKLSGSQ